MPRDITDAMNDNIVKYPSTTQAVCPKTQQPLTTVTMVTGMLSIDTKMSAEARFKINMLVMLRRFGFLQTIRNKLTFPIEADKQIKQSVVTSEIVTRILSVILVRRRIVHKQINRYSWKGKPLKRSRNSETKQPGE